MGIEIERKYLVHPNLWEQEKKLAKGLLIRQGYLSLAPERTVRVRTKGEQAFLTIKGKNKGIVRSEFEYSIPMEDALAMLQLCEGAIIEKTRFKINHEGLTWEVDEFYGDNEGLIVAEVELENELQMPTIPHWVAQEVSDDRRYYNASLVQLPFKNF